MALSSEELTLYRTRLTQAENALHSLMCGAQVVRVQDQSGESVTYGTANVSRLRSYIAELKTIIAGNSLVLDNGPIRPQFL